jgi:hypothetical protein
MSARPYSHCVRGKISSQVHMTSWWLERRKRLTTPSLIKSQNLLNRMKNDRLRVPVGLYLIICTFALMTGAMFFRERIQNVLLECLLLWTPKRKKRKKKIKVGVRFIPSSLDGAPIISTSHTHPSHSQTSRLLTSSLSLGMPVPRTTQCMWGM